MSGFIGVGIGPYPIGRTGTPADPVPVAGAELIVNGGFDSDTAWTKGDGWSISGGYAVRDTSAATADFTQTVALTGAYQIMAFTVVTASGGFVPRFGGASFSPSEATPGIVLRSGRAASGVFGLRCAATSTGTADNFSVKELTLLSLFSTRAHASADCDLSAAVTRTTGTQAGFVARLDSASSPANFIIAYLDGGGNVKVDKCVSGTYTNIISGAVTYGSTKRLRLVCSGTSVSAYYDGTQVGSTVTVSDAGIVSNTRHGKFSTYASNTFAGYVAA